MASIPAPVVLGSHKNAVWSVAFSPDGRTIATGSYDKTARLFDATTGNCLRTLTGHTNAVGSVVFSPDGRTIATGSYNNTARLFDVTTGNCLRTLLGHTNYVVSVAFSPDGRTIATGSHDSTVRLFDVTTGNCLRTLTGHTREVVSVAFSPDGRTIATGSYDNKTRLFDVTTGNCLRTPTGHTNYVVSVAFSPDGRTIATGSHDKTARLVDVTTGNCLRTLTGHTREVVSVAFSPDGRTIATGSHDKTARLFDVTTGNCLRTLDHAREVVSVAFSPDGRTIVTGSYNSTARLWDVSSVQEEQRKEEEQRRALRRPPLFEAAALLLHARSLRGADRIDGAHEGNVQVSSLVGILRGILSANGVPCMAETTRATLRNALAAEKRYAESIDAIRKGTVDQMAHLTAQRNSARAMLVDAVNELGTSIGTGGISPAAHVDGCASVMSRLRECGSVSKFGEESTKGSSLLTDVAYSLRMYEEWQRKRDASLKKKRNRTDAIGEKLGACVRAFADSLSVPSGGASSVWTKERIAQIEDEARALCESVSAKVAVEAATETAVEAPPIGRLLDAARRIFATASCSSKEMSNAMAELHRLMPIADELRPFVDGTATQPTDAEARRLQDAIGKHGRRLERIQLNLKHAIQEKNVDEADSSLAEKKAEETKLRELATSLELECFHLLRFAGTHFPELRVQCSAIDVATGMELGGVFSEAISLQTYAMEKPLSSGGVASRHTIVLARRLSADARNAEKCVLKQFSIDAKTGRREFLREARRLVLLRHPHVVAVTCIFIDAVQTGVEGGKPFGFIEMPYYENGDIASWVARTNPSAVLRRRALQGVLRGLEHVHHEGIVHCDIKPQNMLIDADGRGVLADFDVSINNADRTLAFKTVAPTRPGGVVGTEGYIAPEVLKGGSVTAHSDMYSFALSVFDVHFPPVGARLNRPLPHDVAFMGAVIRIPDECDAPLREFLKATLLAPQNAHERPASRAALSMAYFSAHADGIAARNVIRECIVCFESFAHAEGIECVAGIDAGHFVCRACLGGYVASCAEPQGMDALKRNRSAIRCPERGCAAAAYDVARIAELVSADVYTKLIDAQWRIKETEVVAHMEAQYEKQREEERRVATLSAAAEDHRRRISDGILTLKCPRCQAAFVDFVGCFALTCGRCGGGFCGWCLLDCGADAHGHVARCPRRLSRDALFGDFALFERTHRERRERDLRTYIAGIGGADVRVAVENLVRRDAADLGIRI